MDTSVMKERNQEWIQLAEKLHDIQNKITYLESEKTKLSLKLRELSEFTDSCGANEEGIFEYRAFDRVGSINYKDIPALKDMDLTPFRNKNVTFWKLMFKPQFEEII